MFLFCNELMLLRNQKRIIFKEICWREKSNKTSSKKKKKQVISFISFKAPNFLNCLQDRKFPGGRGHLHQRHKNHHTSPASASETQFKRGSWELHPLQASGKRQLPLGRRLGSSFLLPGSSCAEKQDRTSQLTDLCWEPSVIIELA